MGLGGILVDLGVVGLPSRQHPKAASHAAPPSIESASTLPPPLFPTLDHGLRLPQRRSEEEYKTAGPVRYLQSHSVPRQERTTPQPPINMKVAAILLATLAMAAATAVPAVPAFYAGGAPILGAPLLPKVKYNAAEVSVVKQPVEVQQPEVTYRKVPVPYSVPYAVPYSVPYPVKVPVAHPVPVPVAHHAVAYAAPYAAPYGYGYGLPYGIAAPAVVKA